MGHLFIKKKIIIWGWLIAQMRAYVVLINIHKRMYALKLILVGVKQPVAPRL